MNRDIGKMMFEIFSKVQINKTSHRKYDKKLKTIYKQTNFDQFCKSFLQCLVVPLTKGEKNVHVENLLVFAAKFAINPESLEDATETEREEMNPLLKFLFDFLFTHHNAGDQSVRFRICYFLNMLLNFMEDDASLDDSLCDKIIESMMQRLLDKWAKVRVQAVRALHRLQDPTDDNCPVIKVYIYHLSKDPHCEVRKGVLASMAKNKITLPAVLKRTRDVDEYVRKMAYEFISKVTVRSLTIKQREQLLNDGLKDKSNVVKRTVGEVLLPSWLGYFKGDLVALVRALDPEIGTEIALLALNVLSKRSETKTLMDQLPLDAETKLVPLDKLKSEIVLYWRSLVEFFHRESCAEEIEQCLPELSKFCDYIRTFMSTILTEENDCGQLSEQQFVLHQLFEIAKSYDLSDENGREKLKAIMTDALMIDNCTIKLVECIVKYYEIVVPNVDLRLADLTRVISETQLPFTQTTEVPLPVSEDVDKAKKYEIAKLKVKLNEIVEEEYEAIQRRDFVKAQTLKEQTDAMRKNLDELCTPKPVMLLDEDTEENNDPPTLIRCLTIMYHMISVKSVTNLTPNLRSLLENLVQPNLDHDDTMIYILALKCVGVCCLLDRELAKERIMMYFCQFSVDEQCIEIWVVSLQVIFDLLLHYGFEFFGIEQYDDRTDALEDGTNVSSTLQSDANADDSKNLVKIIIGLLDNQDEKLRIVATEGLCKLLLHGRIGGAHLLSRLIILLYNPISEADAYLRQCLCNFFRNFVVRVSDSQEMLEQAFFPTLKMLANAPDSSPLQAINPHHIAEFIIGLTSSRNHKAGFESHTVHNNLALSILAEALDPSSEIDSETLLKALKTLDIRFEDNVLKNNAREAADKIIDSMKESERKLLTKYVKQFMNKFTEEAMEQTQQEEEASNPNDESD